MTKDRRPVEGAAELDGGLLSLQTDPRARSGHGAERTDGRTDERTGPGYDVDATRIEPAAAFPSPQTLPGPAAADAASVRQVGRYLVKEHLGRGGMASVYRAHDPGIGRDVAIKFLHPSLCEDAEYRGRFLREARAAGGLSHPNIVTVHDVGEIDGRPYMAMELLSGDALADVMQDDRPLPIRDTLVMGIQLARALDYAHAHGIVHRDIKPGNIVRLRGGSTVKVTDFGIAHMEAMEAGEQRTRVGDVLGTPQYMSPEQTQGSRLDGRSDLFSTGIVLYQMLAGQRPFTGGTPYALQARIVNEEPPSLEKLRPELPSQLRRIVERCLAKAPDRRFQTGAELADALTRVLAELDEQARLAAEPRTLSLRVKWAATMALIVAVVMGLSTAVIHRQQEAALTQQVSDYGASLARFIAAQNAVAAVEETWPQVEVAVQEMLRTGDFRSITVVDRAGIVRASGDALLVGQPFQSPVAESLGMPDGQVAMTRHAVDGEPVLGFAAPIRFQDKVFGRVSVALKEEPLLHVARLSLGLMAGLVLVTVLAVAVAMYFVAESAARPIRRLVEAMDEVARGRFDHRIAQQRRDEYGRLYAAFDHMAQALQAMPVPVSMPMPTPTPTQTQTQTQTQPPVSETKVDDTASPETRIDRREGLPT